MCNFGKFRCKGTHIVFHNINRLYCKLDEVRFHLNASDIDAICFAETFLKESHFNHELLVPGFKFLRQDRTMCGGGGFMLYYKDCLNVVHRTDISCNLQQFTESIWVEIVYPHSKNVLLGFIYRSPSESVSEWYDPFETMIIRARETSLHTIILGDFVIDLLRESGSQHLCDLMSSYGMEQLVDKPTRITDTSRTLIDHIYVSNSSYVSEVCISSLSLSDHFPVGLTWKKGNSTPPGGHKQIHYSP